MTTQRWQLALIPAAALALAGCDNSSSTPPTPATTHTEAVETHTEAAHEHAEAAEKEVEKAGEAIKEEAAAAAEDSSVAQANAQQLLEQAIAYINENKLDLADKTLTQLEGMELPEAFAGKIADARTLLDAKKNMDTAGDAADKLKGMMSQ